MKKVFIRWLCYCFLVLFLPYIVTTILTGDELSEEAFSSGQISIYQIEGNSKKNMTVDEYIIGAIAGNMPLSYENETLKAQAVILRTEIYYYLSKHLGEGPNIDLEELGYNYLSEKELEKLYTSEQYKKMVSKLENIVYSTKNEIIIYKEEPIHALFHYSNNGETRNYSDDDETPYLSSVSSPNDIQADESVTIEELSLTDVYNKLSKVMELDDTTVFDDNNNILVKDRDEQGYVTEVIAYNKVIKGTAFQEYFQLKSCNFYLEEKNKTLKIICKGKGSGYGLSQYGANCMAKEGKSYKELIQYYYKDVELKNLEKK